MGHSRWLATTALLLLQPDIARGDPPGIAEGDMRYLAMGDSLGAGQGAVPQTQGYAYRLYGDAVLGGVNGTLLTNIAGSGGITSTHVLAHQLPLAEVFRPDVVTLTVGGNDLLGILDGADPLVVLGIFQANLFQILSGLCSLPSAPRIFVGNQYDVPELTGAVAGGAALLAAFNGIVASVAQAVLLLLPACELRVVDVHAAFLGREGLLLIDRQGAGPLEVHPTTAGHRVLADAFRQAILTP
jgi:lysophospholipase L1-like esterase